MSEISLRTTVNERQLLRALAHANFQGRFKALTETPRLDNRFALWRAVVDQIGADEPLTVFDFGVHKGQSTQFWSEHFKNAETRIFGFDSFVGLPEDWVGKMTKGKFSTNGKAPDMDDSRVDFQIGWIQNTLPGFLKENPGLFDGTTLIHIDTDIYSAALFILTTIWHHAADFFIVFDEFSVDESLALADFMDAYPVDLKFFTHTFNNKSKMPLQVFGRVRRKQYEAS